MSRVGGDLTTGMRHYLADVIAWTSASATTEGVDDLGLRENTIIVFSSDHGGTGGVG